MSVKRWVSASDTWSWEAPRLRATCGIVLPRADPDLRDLAESTRIARNGAIVDRAEALREGDEVAFLPPVGGG